MPIDLRHLSPKQTETFCCVLRRGKKKFSLRKV